MGSQLPSSPDSEISQKGFIWSSEKILGEAFQELAFQKESGILEGHLLGNHVHMLIPIPPKYAVSQVVAYLKGKSAILITGNYTGRSSSFTGLQFSARGYYVSTAGRDQETIR
jgi:putative transposase